MNQVFNLLDKTSEVIWKKDNWFEEVEATDVSIIDQNVWHLYPEKIKSYFREEQVYLFTAKEENKSLHEFTNFINWLSQKEFSRKHTIWGIGGGITTDFAGFAASVYKRGCRLKLVPTTLLAMIDAALGGKTALNFGNLKNGIGSFYPAEKIYMLPQWLSTLPPSEFDNGIIEMIKTSLLKKTDIYDAILKSNGKMDDTMLTRIALIKMELCQADPQDRGIRRFLNLGHTFAHVLEAASNYTIPHGKCVLKGIRAAALFSLRARYITAEIAEKIVLPFKQLKLDFVLNEKVDISPELFFQDKKADKEVNLILFNGFQSVFIYPTRKVHLLKEVLEEVLYESL
jgi:3-dehydroquinate synthase